MSHAFEIQLASWCYDGINPPFWVLGTARRTCTKEGCFAMTGPSMGEVASHLDEIGVEYTQIRNVGPVPFSLTKEEVA